MNFLEKMQSAIEVKVENHQPGLYVVLIFPIAFATLLTFIFTRVFSYYFPWIGFYPVPDLHVHHYIYGIACLIAAAYLALIFNSPRAKFFIALLLGVGLGLAFDEFSYWFKLTDDEVARWEYDGIIVLITLFFLILTAKPGVQFLWRSMPLPAKQSVQKHGARKRK